MFVLCPPLLPPQYGLNFYLDYLAKWPEYCQMAVGPAQQAMGYSECGPASPLHLRLGAQL